MKKLILLISLICFLSCKEETDCCDQTKQVAVTLLFKHHWNGTPVSSDDFNQFKFTTENGDLISINRLRYVVSNINLGNENLDYHLITIGEESSYQLTLENVSQGESKVGFTFGFSDEDNLDGVYQDLNSVSFNVPLMLGGGYHYMQFDGKYKNQNNEDANFNYHAIRAADRSNPNNLILQDTSFEFLSDEVQIKPNISIVIEMNIAEWFKNPNTWDLNELNTVLMPNFEAQLLMSENGKSVFSLGEIID